MESKKLISKKAKSGTFWSSMTTIISRSLGFLFTVIADVLLNQKVLAGVGNYIRADALYLSKISPYRRIKDLSDKEITILLKNIKKVITRSYNCQLKIALGEYDYKRMTSCYKFYVYSRKTTAKGEKVDHAKMKNDRTIWWVPSVQK